MTMYDTLASRPIHSDADGFTDLVRRLDLAEPSRAGAADHELAFDEELRFEERGRAPRRARERAKPRKAVRAQTEPAAPKPEPVLRLVAAIEASESVAVEDAQMHARSESQSWKEYVENMDRFLALELDDETAAAE